LCLFQVRDVERPHDTSQRHDTDAGAVHCGQVEGLYGVVERAEEFMGVRVWFVEFWLDPQLSSPNNFARYRGGCKQTCAAEEKYRELT
jgi:hypothetical protein